MGRKRVTMKLTERADGRLSKVIDGRTEYFGTADDPDAALLALSEFVRLRERGVAAPAVTPGAATVRVIAETFLLDARDRVAQGKIQQGSLDDYNLAIEQFANLVGANVLVDDLVPADFTKARESWRKTLGPWKLDNRVQSVRTMFRWAGKHRLIEREPFYGDAFSKTTPADKARNKRKREAERGERKFARRELVMIFMGRRNVRRRLVVPPLDGHLLAFVLLGLNGGMYSKDIADLDHTDLKRLAGRTVIDTYRGKTSAYRRTPLWQQTVDAIKDVATSAKSGPLFKTVWGNRWHHGETDAIGQEFAKRLELLGIHRDGVGFGTVKHTHVSAVGDCADVSAARVVRAHRVPGIESHYDLPDIKRLAAVTELAASRLLPVLSVSATASARADRVRASAESSPTEAT